MVSATSGQQTWSSPRAFDTLLVGDIAHCLLVKPTSIEFTSPRTSPYVSRKRTAGVSGSFSNRKRTDGECHVGTTDLIIPTCLLQLLERGQCTDFFFFLMVEHTWIGVANPLETKRAMAAARMAEERILRVDWLSLTDCIYRGKFCGLISWNCGKV
jgi:hypothetical protein